MNKLEADLIIANAAQLLTCAEGPLDSIGLINKGWLALKGERIIAVGTQEEIMGNVETDRVTLIDASDKVVAPGFVDCHTHLVFGGSRVNEYTAKLTTTDPAKLRERGIKTGIMVTVEDTRNASIDDLFHQASPRLRDMILTGTTTVESKSGYGLSLESEINLLKVNRKLEKSFPIDVISTFLGAHGWPADISKEGYIELLKKEMIPAVAEQGLARFCDIWCDDGHYTVNECRDILQTGLDFGLDPKIHTGAYSYVGGADLAAELRMASADHLNYTPRQALKKLAAANVIGVLLPGIDFAVNHPLPFDPKPMVEEGLTLALATNCCPGCWCNSMQFIMVLACRQHTMSPEIAMKAATLGSAKALRLGGEIGSLEVGKLADIQIWDVPRFEDVVYHLGGNVVHSVIKRGRISVKNGKVVL